MFGKVVSSVCTGLFLCGVAALAKDDLSSESFRHEPKVFPALRSERLSDLESESDLADEIGSLTSARPTYSKNIEQVKFDELSAPGEWQSSTSEPCESCDWHPLDTLSLFGGLEGSKQPQDFGVNANFGSRWAANWGFPLLAEYGLGGQIGTSLNLTDNAVQVFERVGETAHRTQVFSTIGVFQRLDRWTWGVGYDFLYQSYFDPFYLGQFRGRAGYSVTPNDECGVWVAISQKSDSGQFLNIPVTLTPLTQGSIYWQHQFSAGTRTMAWMGISEGHAQANLALGDLKKTGNQFVFGAEVDVPLNRYLAMYGQANFISPADSGTVDSYLGIAYYPSGHAFPTDRSPFAPLLALANSTMFAINLSR